MVTPTAQARQVAAILSPEAHDFVSAVGQTNNQKIAQVVREHLDLGIAVRRAEHDPALLAETIRQANVACDEAVMVNLLTPINHYVEAVARRRPEDAAFLIDHAAVILRQRAGMIAEQLGTTIADIRTALAARAEENR